MTVKGFYRQLLSDIAVKDKEIDDARTRRNELRGKLATAVGRHAQSVETFPSGALAAGTQISPLNDVDVVVTVPNYLAGWLTDPAKARRDVRAWVEPLIDAKFEFSTHAIKLTYRDEEFTADIVVGVRRARGIVIPHCPDDEPHIWLPSDPKRHGELVRERNLPDRPALFSQQIRILKALNRYWQMSTDDNRKPLSSFHISALALAIFTNGVEVPHDEGTPRFLEQAAQMVHTALPDPAGVGPDIEARNPSEAAALLADAARKTRSSLSLPDDDALDLLNDVFGDPAQRAVLLAGAPVSVAAGGKFVPAGAAAAGIAPTRPVKPVRSHGD
jgi:hypothetical protein